MKIDYRKDPGASLMLIEGSTGLKEYDFTLKMLRSGTIPHLLPFSTETVNGTTLFLYDISGKHSFRKTFELHRFTFDMLIAFLAALKEVSESLSDHLLDADILLITADTVYADHSFLDYYFCCLPGLPGGTLSRLKDFFGYLPEIIDYEDRRLVTLAFALNRLSQNDNFTLADVFSEASRAEAEPSTHSHDDISALAEHKEDPLPHRQLPFTQKAKIFFAGKTFSEIFDAVNSGRLIKLINDVPAPADIPEEVHSLPSEPASVSDAPVSAPAPSGEYPDVQDDTDYYSGKTEPLNRSSSLSDIAFTAMSELPFHRLTGLEPSPAPVIILDHFPFTIGKSCDQTDYHLERPTVSRTHCRIYEYPDKSFGIEDLNSKNGTYINDICMDPYKRQPLMPGDTVQLADMKFLFL